MAFIRPSLLYEATPVLRTERIVLRQPLPSDYAAWAALRDESRDHLTPFEPQWSLDELSRHAFRERVRRYQREARVDQSYAFLVFGDDRARQLVGGISLLNVRRGVSQSASVGYWIGHRYARNGFAKAALGSVTRYAFERLRLHRLEAACMPSNQPSLRTLEGGGFLREGIARSYLKINGRWEDHVLFGLTGDDWLRNGRA